MKSNKKQNKTKNDKRSQTWLINVSWIFSLFTLASRIINDDFTLFAEKWRNLDFTIKKCPIVNWRYLYRAIFRICDVSGRIGLLSLTWIAINGYVTFALILFDFIIVCAVIYKTNTLSLFVFFFFFDTVHYYRFVIFCIYNFGKKKLQLFSDF